MPVAPAALGDSVADMLAARGIHYHPLFTFRELRPETREVVASDGSAHRVDLLMIVPPHQAPEAIRSSPLLGVSGFVHVDPRTLGDRVRERLRDWRCCDDQVAQRQVAPEGGRLRARGSQGRGPTDRRRRRGKTPGAEFKGNGYCWIELGDGRAGFAGGNFYADPEPSVKLRRPGRPLHWGKIAFEKWWLHHWL